LRRPNGALPDKLGFDARLRRNATLPFGPHGRMLSLAGTRENSMSKAGLDNRHRNHDGEISHKHGNTLIGTLRKIYGRSFQPVIPKSRN
jgi:hypothetical protein